MSDAPPPLPGSGSDPARAHRKFSCPACGAEATWDPARQELVCGYCGNRSPAQEQLEAAAEGGAIKEHDLLAMLHNLPADRQGWQEQRTEVRCQHCDAISVFDPARVGQRCDFCGAAALVPYEEVEAILRPESLLPLKVGEAAVRESMRRWYATRWFAPGSLARHALTDTLHGIYLPYWTFDAHVAADWEAESGYHYYVTEHYTDAQGRRQTRRARRTRWESSRGSLRHFFDDSLVAGSRGVKPKLLAAVEPFPTADLVPYNTGYLAGWTVERYQIDLDAAATRARERMTGELHALCARQVPGDTHRNLRVHADWSGQTFKHILVPVWLLTYDHHHKSYQVVVNGSTGRIAGERPYSVWKILGAILAVLAFAGILTLIASRR